MGKPVSSEFPLFSCGFVGEYKYIGGGGGSSKSGVPNSVQLFRDNTKVAEMDFAQDLVNCVYPVEDKYLFVVTQQTI